MKKPKLKSKGKPKKKASKPKVKKPATRELNDKQRMFAQEYIVDFNGTQAAIRANYSKKSASRFQNELLKKPQVLEHVAKLIKERSEKVNISKEFVLEGFKEVALRCLQREPVMVFNHVTKAMEQVQEENEAGEMCDVWQFNANGANRAFEMLGKHLGLFNEKFMHLIGKGDDLEFSKKFFNTD